VPLMLWSRGHALPRWRGVRQSAIRLEQPGHPPLDGVVADTVPELPGIRHPGVLAAREVEPSPDKRRVLREPSMPKPKPVEANAGAAPGVTSSNACCQAAETWGVTSVAPQCIVVAARRHKKGEWGGAASGFDDSDVVHKR